MLIYSYLMKNTNSIDHICKVIHKDVVNNVKQQMPHDDSFVYDLAEFFKAFADGTRLRILLALRISEMCVCDIAALLGMNHSAISHQLRILSHLRLVKQRKYGKVVYYTLNDVHVKALLDLGFEHVNE